jgi:antitoxin MazE
MGMVKRLQAVGNSSGIIIDKPILELLRITPDTELDVSTDGERLIISPIRPEPSRRARFTRAQARTLAAHERTFRKLAK